MTSQPSVLMASWGCGPRLPQAEGTSEALLLCVGPGRRDEAGPSDRFQLPALPMQHLF